MKLYQLPKDQNKVEKFFSRNAVGDLQTETLVRGIIERVRRQGDPAVSAYTQKFDGVQLAPTDFIIPRQTLKKAWLELDRPLQAALKKAHARIKEFHKRQMLSGYVWKDTLGNRMEQRVKALRRVGVYVPGGTAAYPSTVLMDIVPAKVAGVKEIVMITPPIRQGILQDGSRAALGAAWLAGVDEVVGIGGAQGIAAMALGTQSLRRVDKIVGPGNRFVAAAKKILYGEIDIDMVAGPSEVLILADKTAPPEFIAADMLAQAEHDVDAQSVVVLIGKYDRETLQKEIRKQTKSSLRKEIISKSLRRHGAIIEVRTRAEAVRLANLKAPEHLEIMTANPRALANKIDQVGAIFIGAITPEPMGDYILGPNHTLPTSGSARFYSPLSVLSFLKTSNVLECSAKGFASLAESVELLAQTEGLAAHAQAVRLRREKKS